MDKRAMLDTVDRAAAHLHLNMFGESGGLSAFLFHSIFKSEQEIGRNHVNPTERMTVDRFRKFLDFFLAKGYRFVTPAEIKNGLPDDGNKYGLISFDDGYFNNTLILPLLKSCQVPAVFFISTAYTIEQKKFWSDVVYEKRKQENRTDLEILYELMELKKKKVGEIETWLKTQFGDNCLQPLSDIDRPMNESELADFARHPFVHIGNHTHQHEVLTNLTREEVSEEFAGSQQILKGITGNDPWFVSYPNGSYSNMIIEVAVQHGLDMGITTIMRKNKLPLQQNAQGQWLLDRFNPAVDSAGRDNFNTLRSSFQLKTQLKRWLQ